MCCVGGRLPICRFRVVCVFCFQAEDGIRDKLGTGVQTCSLPISPYRVIWDLMHNVDLANTIITHDAGSPRDQISPFWEPVAPLSYIGWGKTTQLGYGLGLAMGAKLAHPEKLCIN